MNYTLERSSFDYQATTDPSTLSKIDEISDEIHSLFGNADNNQFDTEITMVKNLDYD